MPTLNDYHNFGGRHWETGSVHNHWAYRRFKAPHTQQPYSEALLMGISGGIVMGYFSFAYDGYDPHVALLTRNTFDPLDALLTRLGIEQIWLQSTKPAKGAQNLVEALNDGVPPLVWADQYTLPYNALPNDPGMWHMAPLTVFGYDPQADPQATLQANSVSIADRASVALTTSVGAFDQARGRVKQDKHKLLVLEMPDPDKLSAAVSAGIWSCIKLFTEKPPKGSRDNFGFAAYQRWAELLTKPNQRLSWEKEFPAGRKLFAGLTSTFDRIALFGQDGVNMDAERGTYADFLEEAAEILKKPDLRAVASHFRHSGQAWRELAHRALPDSVPLLQEARHLLVQRHRTFITQGNAAHDTLVDADARLAALAERANESFPLDADGVEALRAQLAQQVLQIHDLERTAINLLERAMQ